MKERDLKFNQIIKFSFSMVNCRNRTESSCDLLPPQPFYSETQIQSEICVEAERIYPFLHYTRNCFRFPVISYPDHFIPKSFRTYFGHFVPSNNHFVPRSFGTHLGHFVPSWCRMDAEWMPNGWMDGRTCFNWNDKWTSYSSLLHNEIPCDVLWKTWSVMIGNVMFN